MIVCENLVKIYSLAGVEVMALQGLDLTVQEGEMLGIVGASGSGKTTLMNVLGGLDRPTAGKVTVFERELLKLSDAALDVYRRTQVGFVWQQASRNLVPYLTALENVELPLRLAHLPAAERQSRALELLETLGIGDRLHHRPDQLSGGEQQRAAIGVAMANRPLLLLADEPTGELDTATSVEVFNALRKVNTLYSTTTIIVSHDGRIGQFVDRVVVIRDGRTSSETRESRIESRESNEGRRSSESRIPNHESRMTDPASRLSSPDELVILDAAGRMQIPREFLERLNIGDRVRLELDGNHIAIQPVEGHGRAPVEPETELPGPEDLYVEAEDAAPATKQNSIRERLRQVPRWLKIRQKRSDK
jgi:ABC-type lipoprotein export system ATPase subunit/antitoxin component of MazEF toxin-antitoxin module